MNKQLAPWLVLSCSLFVIAGCKKDAAPQTAADATVADPVVVLDVGREPKLLLRYRIAAGTTTTSTTTLQVAMLATSKDAEALTVLPGLRLQTVAGPATTTENGVRFNIDTVKSEAVVLEDSDEALVADLQAGAAVLEGVGGWVEIDNRGAVLAGAFNEAAKRGDVPARLLRMIINARSAVTRVLLPAEPVGIGARWEAKRETEFYGFKVTHVSTYQLVDKAGDELMLDFTSQRVGLPQKITFPEEGIEIAVESMSAKAAGRLILNLEALESDASARGTSVDKIVVKTVSGTESIEADEEFVVQIANTTHLMPSQPDETAGKRKRTRRR